ncbi:MAG: Crp/Fnr family transcriptional regulator [Pseudonocardiaceae bacterium]
MNTRWPQGSLLGSLSQPEQAELLTLGAQRTVGRNEVLIHQAASGRDLYLLLRGCVKVLSTSAAGHTVLLAVRLAGDLVGELAALDGLPRSATVITAARTTLRSIGHVEFGAHLATRPAVAAAVHRSVVAKLRQATRFRSDTSGSSVLVRLARVLDLLGMSYGRESPAGVLVDVYLTQAELAALIGAAEVSVQRALGELRTRGLVRTGYRQLLIIDPDGLRTLLAKAEE